MRCDLIMLLQVEIVMALEEEFDINVEEENSQNITTVREAADMIDKLVQDKAEGWSWAQESVY